MHSRVVPCGLQGPIDVFVEQSLRVYRAECDELSGLRIAAAQLRDSCVAVQAEGCERPRAEVTQASKRLLEALRADSKSQVRLDIIAEGCKSLLLATVALLCALEQRSAEITVKEVRRLKNALSQGDDREVRGAREALAAVLIRRKSETMDAKGRETLEKLLARIDKDCSSWLAGRKGESGASLSKALDLLERFVAAFTKSPESVVLDSSFFDPRDSRLAARGIVQTTVAGDGRGVVAWAKKLLEQTQIIHKHCSADARKTEDDSLRRLAASFKDESKELIASSQRLVVGKGNVSATDKAAMAETARKICDFAASFATEQHRAFSAKLRSQFLIYGEITRAAIVHSLVSLGSDPERTQEEFVWGTTASASKKRSSAADNNNSRNGNNSNHSHSASATAASSAKKRASGRDASTAAPSGNSQQQQQQHQHHRPQPPVPVTVVRKEESLLPVMGKCHACGGEVRGRIVSALGAQFHPHHFACLTCGREIQTHESFMSHPSNAMRPQCSNCSNKDLASQSAHAMPLQPSPNNHGPCRKCGRVVEGKEYVVAFGKNFHNGCLQCGECGITLYQDSKFGKSAAGFIVCDDCLRPPPPRAVPATIVRPSRTSQGLAQAAEVVTVETAVARVSSRPTADTSIVMTGVKKPSRTTSDSSSSRTSTSAAKKSGVAAVSTPLASSASVSSASSAPSSSGSRYCRGCSKPIVDGDGIPVLWDGATVYHKPCFACRICQKNLGAKDADFFEYHGDKYCRECYQFKLYNCASCGNPLRRDGSEVMVGSDQYHSACAGKGAAAAPPPPVPARPAKAVPTPVVSSSSSRISGIRSKPLPEDPPADSPPTSRFADLSPSVSPPMSPAPPVRPAPRWSLSLNPATDGQDSSQPVDDEDIDNLLDSLMPTSERLKKPLMRTSTTGLYESEGPSTSSKPEAVDVDDHNDDEASVEACWACNALNPANYNVCFSCKEANLTVPKTTVSALEDWSVPEAGHVENGEASKTHARHSFEEDEDELSKLISELNEDNID